MKPTALTSGCWTSAVPTSRLPPWIRLKTPGWTPVPCDRGMDRLRDDLAGARMRRVALDDHRAAGGERRGGVAAGRREGEREIRGAEYRDRADRPLDHHEIGPRHRLAVGQRDVVAAVEVVALADVLGEEAELPDGAPALAFEPGRGQAGLGAADRGDGLGARLDLVGDARRERPHAPRVRRSRSSRTPPLPPRRPGRRGRACRRRRGGLRRWPARNGTSSRRRPTRPRSDDARAA